MIKKYELSELLRSYATRAFEVDNGVSLFYASEEAGYPCYEFFGKDFCEKRIVWESGGGCMSIIPVPHKKNEFLAILDFYLKVTPSKSRVVWGHKENDKWVVQDILHLPYLHRFEIFDINGELHFVGATIADDKKSKDDWSLPGSIYTGVFPKDFNEGLTVSKLSSGYYRNHGLSKHIKNDKEVVYISSDYGVIELTPPYEGEWKIEKILEGKISEIAIGDIDGDGLDEIITIEPFHGDTIKIYKLIDGDYKPIYIYDNPIDFGHALVFCTLEGVPTFLAGIRRLDCELVAFQCIDGKIEKKLIDTGGGPANIYVYNEVDRDLILSANHTENKAVVYVIEKN